MLLKRHQKYGSVMNINFANANIGRFVKLFQEWRAFSREGEKTCQEMHFSRK